MEFVKFNSKLFLFTDIFDLTLIFRISTRPKIAKERNSLGNKLAFVGLISNIFLLLGRFGILGPIRWPFRYSRADSMAVSVLSGRFGGRFGILGPIRYSYAPAINRVDITKLFFFNSSSSGR